MCIKKSLRPNTIINVINLAILSRQLPARRSFLWHSFLVLTTGLSLGQAAYHSSQTKHSEKWIQEPRIAVVYRFFQYPKGYKNPPNTSTQLDKAEVERLWALGHRRLCDYYTFQKNFAKVSKKVYRTYKDGGISQILRETDIDNEMKLLSGT
jgi:hypothetical protein